MSAAAPLRIALLGAESTGKTALATGLAEHYRARGWPCTLVPEYLRSWCDAAGRTPRPDEQLAIAQEQIRLAQSQDTAGLLVADTTALMVAVYSDFLFGDSSLYPLALEHQRSYHLTLLTGLDLPWVADGLQRDGAHVRAPVDALVRAALEGAGIGYRVVYGSGAARLENALIAINSIASEAHPESAGNLIRSKDVEYRPWRCEQCSEPACEHRLFQRLQAH